ncbi:MAG: hypothetical protein WKF59_21915 [Chitinophagaceae bacterium]
MNEEENIEEQSTEDIPKHKETVNEVISQKPPIEVKEPQTENMEVHHHTHPAHHKKNWKDYFWEFLMLFLAVFCGFLAEYQLEHKIEKERGREYVKSFREDLCKDTAILRLSIETLKTLSIAGDSLVKILQQNRIQLPEDLKKLYDYNLTSLAGVTSINSDRPDICAIKKLRRYAVDYREKNY